MRDQAPFAIYVLIDVRCKGVDVDNLSIFGCDWPVLMPNLPREVADNLGLTSFGEQDIYLRSPVMDIFPTLVNGLPTKSDNF